MPVSSNGNGYVTLTATETPAIKPLADPRHHMLAVPANVLVAGVS